MIHIRSHVETALQEGLPVVALESTLIAHGLPWPQNLQTALAAEQTIREHGVTPATIGVVAGLPTVGLNEAELRHFAQAGPETILKASRRDLPVAIVHAQWAATTVSATMALAHRSGIRVLATGGIGGVHPALAGQPLDVSADLIELSRTPVAVVCAGAKSILDLPATLEMLETLGVPVVGYRTQTFPAFYVASSGLPVAISFEELYPLRRFLQAHWQLDGAGVVIAQPVKGGLDPALFAAQLQQAEAAARGAGVRGAALTPFLLARLAETTHGESLRVNERLIIANADLAAQLAQCLIEDNS
ncbi:MAG: pseudouridine-5'-phosphate glycosidase [Gemmataceae bacterium]